MQKDLYVNSEKLCYEIVNDLIQEIEMGKYNDCGIFVKKIIEVPLYFEYDFNYLQELLRNYVIKLSSDEVNAPIANKEIYACYQITFDKEYILNNAEKYKSAR